MTTYERIQYAAKKRGMNLREVAKAAGLKSETAIYRYNQGVTPRESTLRAIADVLGVSVEYLLGHTDDMLPVNSSKGQQTVNLDEALSDEGIAMFDGEPLSEEYKKALLAMLRATKNSEH